MELKEKLTSKALELFNRTEYQELWAIKKGDAFEFFTTENFAQNACKNGEKPLKFERKECIKTEVKPHNKTTKK